MPDSTDKQPLPSVRVGVVGLGYWGPNLLRNFSLVADARLTYACDLDHAALVRWKQRYPNVSFTASYEELLRDPELDAIAISTPVRTHYPLAKQALEAGKHVLIEKPMAASVQECDALIELARSQQRILMVDHTFLYTGAVRKMKGLIQSSALGELYYFDSERVNLGLIQRDINVLWDLAPHDLSIMLYLFEGRRPLAVSATGTRHVHHDQPEVAHATVLFEEGIVAHMHVSWLSPLKLRKILVGGSKQMMLYDDIEPTEKLRIYDKGVAIGSIQAESPFKPVYRSGDILIPKLDDTEALLVEAEHFVRCVQGIEQPLVDGAAGRRVVSLLEACDESMRTHQRVELKHQV